LSWGGLRLRVELGFKVGLEFGEGIPPCIEKHPSRVRLQVRLGGWGWVRLGITYPPTARPPPARHARPLPPAKREGGALETPYVVIAKLEVRVRVS
jgi:hypothetical protein